MNFNPELPSWRKGHFNQHPSFDISVGGTMYCIPMQKKSVMWEKEKYLKSKNAHIKNNLKF